MALVYRNPSYSLSSAGGSSANVSPSSSINEGASYSANQSPLFGGSQHSSPFLRTGGGGFPRTFNPNSLGLSTQGNSRARAASAVTLSPTSPLSRGSSLDYGRDRASMENLQAMYQSHYDGSSQRTRGLEPQLGGGMANFQVNPSSYNPDQTLHGPQNIMRRNSASTVTGSGTEVSFQNPGWFAPSPTADQTLSPDFQLYSQQIRRRQTQPIHSTQQFAASGMSTLPPNQTHESFSSTGYHQSSPTQPQQIAQSQQLKPYASTNLFPTENPRPSYTVSPRQQQSPVKSETSPTDVFQQQQQQQQQQGQGQGHPMYYYPSQQQQQGPGM